MWISWVIRKMHKAGFEIVPVRKGGKSLRCLTRQETFHPVIGPVAEAKILHVQQQQLVERALATKDFILWDVGLGAAANAVSAIEALLASEANAQIHSFDISTDALVFALENAQSLPYLLPHVKWIEELVRVGRVELRPGLIWHFHSGDFRKVLEDLSIPSPHSIFYDPYSPATNRDMWQLDHFMRLRQRINTDCLLTNYTRSTAVRVTWLLAGFHVGIGCVIGDKAETSVASTKLEMLDKPLLKSWLERVRISRNGAPMRDAVYSIEPIGPEDLTLLEQCEQFCH